MQDEADRLVALERNIDQGKYLKDSTDRDLHQFWDAFKSVKERFESFFDALICSAPDQLKESYEEMKKLSEKVILTGLVKIATHIIIALY